MLHEQARVFLARKDLVRDVATYVPDRGIAASLLSLARLLNREAYLVDQSQQALRESRDLLAKVDRLLAMASWPQVRERHDVPHDDQCTAGNLEASAT